MPRFRQILKSKAIWAGAVTIGTAAWQYAAPFIPPQYVPLAMAVAGAVQVVLRPLTTKPLSEK